MIPQRLGATLPADTARDAEPSAPAEPMKICFVSLGNDQFQVYRDAPEGQEEMAESQPGYNPGKPSTGGGEMHETIEGMEPALKALVKLVKANPVGGDEEAGFRGGYSAEHRPGPML